MPRGDGTGPDGKGPKKENKGWPTPTKSGNCKRNRQRNCQKPDTEPDSVDVIKV
jgi:hypothetical protein